MVRFALSKHQGPTRGVLVLCRGVSSQPYLPNKYSVAQMKALCKGFRDLPTQIVSLDRLCRAAHGRAQEVLIFATPSRQALVVRAGVSPQPRALRRSTLARFKALCQCFQHQSRATGLHTRFLRYLQERTQEVLILARSRGHMRVSSTGRLLFCFFLHGKPLFHVSITCPHVLLQFIIKFGAYHTDAGPAAHVTNWAAGLFPMDFVGELVLYRAGQSSKARNQPEELG